MITFATSSDLPDITTLWKAVFDDPPPFTTFVTTQLISSNNTLIDKHHNILRGMTIIFPVNLYTPQKIYHLYYIYGVGVHPQYRNQKIATKLLQHITDYAKKNTMDGLVLMPATESLFSYYAKQNFQTAFSLQKINVEKTIVSEQKYRVLPISISIIAKLRNTFLQTFSNAAILWSEEQMQQRFDAATLNGETWFLLQIENILHYVIVEQKSNNTLLVKESTFMECDFSNLSNFLFTHFLQVTQIEYLLHPALQLNGQIIDKGMIAPLSTTIFNDQNGYLNLCLD